MGRVFPREWERFVELVPEVRREGNVPAAYARLLNGPDPAVRTAAARAWCDWEDTHVSLTPGHQPDLSRRDEAFQLRFARLVTHVWAHDCFLPHEQVFADLHRIQTVPAVLVHGRLDVSSPLATAWRLHRSWPASRLVVLDHAGHGGGDMTGALVGALDTFRGAV